MLFLFCFHQSNCSKPSGVSNLPIKCPRGWSAGWADLQHVASVFPKFILEKKTTSISHTLIFKLEIPSTCCFCAKFFRDVFKSTTINYQIREFHATWRLGNVFLQSRFKNVLQWSLCCSALSAETGFLFEKARPNTNRWMKFNDLSSRYHLFFHKCWPNLLLIGA